MATAIELDRVSKRYTLGEFRGGGDAVRDVISASVRRMVRIERAPQPREHWALRDVSVTRYAILFRTHQAKRAETRARRIGEFVAMLERGETIYPQA